MKNKGLRRGLGSIIKSFDRESIHPSPGLSTTKKNLVYLASYNVLPKRDQSHQKIIVPGSPPIWNCPPGKPLTVKPDSGLYFRDIHGHIFDWPFEPLFRAVLAMRRTLQMSDVDFVADRRNLMLLLQFVSGRNQPFRINIDLVNSTALLSTWVPRQRVSWVGAFDGYGREFEQQTTRKPFNMKTSVAHYQVVRFTLGGMNLIMRYEVDAYIPPSTNRPLQTTLRTRKYHAPTGMTVLRTGDTVARSGLVEIKTKNVHSSGPLLTVFGKLWLGQIPIYCKAMYTGNGEFLPPDLQYVEQSGRLAEWEIQNQDRLQKFICLLEMIKEAVRKTPHSKLSLVNEGDGVLKLFAATRTASTGGVPKDLLKLWGAAQTGKDTGSATTSGK
ncbi:hypothetical protein BJX61DRAFT_452040 [Aspergillus egyptiacus]|nr:hypothetical protein BJX61DRAFT_452040 [Aspergillus egyptiacus]